MEINVRNGVGSGHRWLVWVFGLTSSREPLFLFFLVEHFFSSFDGSVKLNTLDDEILGPLFQILGPILSGASLWMEIVTYNNLLQIVHSTITYFLLKKRESKKNKGHWKVNSLPFNYQLIFFLHNYKVGKGRFVIEWDWKPNPTQARTQLVWGNHWFFRTIIALGTVRTFFFNF